MLLHATGLLWLTVQTTFVFTKSALIRSNLTDACAAKAANFAANCGIRYASHNKHNHHHKNNAYKRQQSTQGQMNNGTKAKLPCQAILFG